MRDGIAVLLNKEGQLAAFTEAIVIAIYKKTSDWQVIRMIPINEHTSKEEDGIKGFTLEIIEELKDCKVIVGTMIVGLPYYLLMRAGYEMCEADSFSITLLDQIKEDYLKSEKSYSEVINQEPELADEEKVNSTSMINVAKSPVPLDESGNFFIDMIAVQKVYPEMSSKKILLPFLSNTLFNSLEINCSHVMPWLDNYLEQRGLITQISKRQGSYSVLITHSLCLN